jgi:putative ABC transport system permease protein
LACRQIPRHHARSSLTVGVLFVAVSTGLGIASAVLDNLEDVRAWSRRALGCDFFVRAMMPDMATGLSADLPAVLETEIPQVPGIQHVETVRFVRASAADEPVIVIVREFAPGTPIYFDLKAGDPNLIQRQLHAGEVVIGTVLAQRMALRVGDSLALETLEGPQRLRIAGLTNEYLVGGLAVHMERQTARRWLGVEGVDGYFIQAQPHARADVQARLQQLCDRHGVLLHSFAEISRLIDSMILGIDGCLWGILVLGFVVAALGVFNTLTMNVLEQTREIGLLRVVAMTRGQVRRMILAQAAILGGAGLVPGTVAGVGLSYVIHLATLPAIGHPVEFGFHPLLASASFWGGTLLVFAAAWFPAERAARLELMTTLQYE